MNKIIIIALAQINVSSHNTMVSLQLKSPLLKLPTNPQNIALSLFRASGIMRFLSANYALFFGELCAKNPKLSTNYANCTIFLCKNF